MQDFAQYSQLGNREKPLVDDVLAQFLDAESPDRRGVARTAYIARLKDAHELLVEDKQDSG
eukprot:3544278-Karenia_brevis.AAC.1